MQVDIIEASLSDKPTIRNMMQLYLYDLTEYEAIPIDKHGLFNYNYLDHYWLEKGRFPFIFKVDDQLAGFSLINQHSNSGKHIDYSIAEFFILKNYRLTGISKQAAFILFDKFRGTWEIVEHKANKPAQAFWRKVISEYTKDKYEDLANGFGNWNGPIQRFDNRK